MTARITIAGGTGNLGRRIVKALIQRGAEVVVLARQGADQKKLKTLTDLGAQIETVNMADVHEIAKACAGSICVVSALAGLRDVIVDHARDSTGRGSSCRRPRFIPSDFSTDYTQLVAGENRNFDLRREFYEKLSTVPIATTHIFTGAFGEILKYNIPMLDFKKKTIKYWGRPKLADGFYHYG